jgi:hypothetical protein
MNFDQSDTGDETWICSLEPKHFLDNSFGKISQSKHVCGDMVVIAKAIIVSNIAEV